MGFPCLSDNHVVLMQLLVVNLLLFLFFEKVYNLPVGEWELLLNADMGDDDDNDDVLMVFVFCLDQCINIVLLLGSALCWGLLCMTVELGLAVNSSKRWVAGCWARLVHTVNPHCLLGLGTWKSLHIMNSQITDH